MTAFGYEHERSIEDDIHELLDNRYQNEPEIATHSVKDLTGDLIAYCDDQHINTLRINEIEPHVESWLVQFAGRI